MANNTHPWSLKGVSPAARQAAKASAEAHGVTLGVWLSRLIRDTAAAAGVTEATIAVPAKPPKTLPEPPPQRAPDRISSIERAMRRGS